MRLGVVLVLAAVTLVAPATGDAQREAKAYVVTKWDGGCSGNTRNSWDNMAIAWYNEITNGSCFFGHCDDAYSRSGQRVNGRVVNSRFADRGVVNWGRDAAFLDDADAALMAWHGKQEGNDYKGSMRVNEPGDGNCKLLRSEMRLGNTDLEFAHLSSCSSLNANQWDHWWKAFDGLHQLNGFHGLMYIGKGHVQRYKNFASASFSGSIADAWLDAMYGENVSGSNDQCPVSYGVGESSSDVATRMASERYNNVMSTPKVNWWGAMYFDGCDPKKAGKL